MYAKKRKSQRPANVVRRSLPFTPEETSDREHTHLGVREPDLKNRPGFSTNGAPSKAYGQYRGKGGGAWLPRWFNLRHVARPAGWSVTRPLSRTCNTAHISKYRGQSQFVFRAMPLSGRPTLLFSRPPNFNSCRYSKRCRSANLDRIEPIRFRHFHWFLEEDNSQKRYFFLFFLE